VTVDQETHSLGPLFFVIATQNPAEQIGTYLLPESQLDRFSVRISMGYPDKNQEREMVRAQMESQPLEKLGSVLNVEDMVSLQNDVSRIRVDDKILDYALSIVDRTRNRDELAAGVSPRGTLSFIRLCQAYAAVEGRDYVEPDDLKALGPAALSHRVIYRGGFRANLDEEYNLIRTILEEVVVP